MSFAHHCQVHHCVEVRDSFICKKYEKQSVFLEMSSGVSRFCFALFILSVIAISIPRLALVKDYVWVISKWLK